MEKQIYCGAGKENITPPAELLLKLPALMGGHFSGKIYDELYVRAVAFQNEENTVLFVSFDLDKAPDPLGNLAAIEEKYGIAQDNVLLFGIHTHTAPLCSVRPFEGMNSRENQPPERRQAMETYENLVREKMLTAVKTALDSLQPARIGWATGKSYINVNRCQSYQVEQEDGSLHTCCALGADPEGPVDHTLFVLKAEDLQGKPIAFLVNYPVHCCVMIGNDSDGQGGCGISGDIAGVTSQLMEAKYGGVCVWSSGAAGDVNPLFMNQYFYPNPKNGAFCEHPIQGPEAAIAILTVLTGRHFADIVSTVRQIQCHTSQAEIKAISGWSKTPRRRVVKKGDEPGEAAAGEAAPAYPIRVHPVVIGDVAFCGISGELYTTLGWEIQKASPAVHTCIINHDACLTAGTGYILDDTTIRRCENNLPGHFLPGGKGCAILPGYVAPSLAALTRELFGKMAYGQGKKSEMAAECELDAERK